MQARIEEGADRDLVIVGTKELIGENGKVTGLKAVRLEMGGASIWKEKSLVLNSLVKADLVFNWLWAFVSHRLQNVLMLLCVKKTTA